jgi:superoxide dismutase
MPRLSLTLTALMAGLAASLLAAHPAAAGWLWSSSSGSEGGLMPHALPYTGDALKGLYESGVVSEVPKKLDEFSSKATEALKQIQNNPNTANELKEAAKDAFNTGNLDKVTELMSNMGKDTVASDAVLRTAKASLESYGGAYQNYAEYFYQLSPTAGGGQPKGQLADRINKDFNSFDSFKKQFIEQANWVWGSSFVWLVADSSGKLSIETSRFQSRPASSKRVILSLYMWERVLDSPAFKGDYKAYADKFFSYVGWDTVAKRYDDWLKEKNEKKQEL